MRDLKKLAVMALAACALVLSTVTAAGAQTHAQRVKPKHYKSLERLTVTLVGFKTYVRKIRATKLGSFRIVIGAIDLNDCNAYKLKVVGALGSRFSLSHPTAPC